MSLVCPWSERGAGVGSVVGVNLRQYEAYRYVVSLPLVRERGRGRVSSRCKPQTARGLSLCR